MPAELVGLETAGLHDALRPGVDAGEEEAVLPVAPFGLHPYPAVFVHLLQVEDFKAQLFSHRRYALPLHDVAGGIAGPAALGQGDIPGPHFLEGKNQGAQGIVVGGAGGGVVGVEVGLEDDGLAPDGVNVEQFNGAANAGGPVGGAHQSYADHGYLLLVWLY